MLNFDKDFHLIRWQDGLLLNLYTVPKQQDNLLCSGELFALPFNVFILNHDTEVLRVNTAAAQTCGFISERDAVGRTIREVARRDVAEEIIKTYKKFLHNQAHSINEENYWRLDGLNFSTTTIKFLLYDQTRKKIGLLGFSLLSGIETNYTQAKGLIWLAQKKLLRFPSSQSVNLFDFTQRERAIAALLIRGKTARSIAQVFCLSVRTVENYLVSMKQKTNTQSKAELVELLITANE